MTAIEWMYLAISLAVLPLGLELVGLIAVMSRDRNEQRKRRILLSLVQAAEMIYGPGKGEAKRRFVREKMKQQGLEKLGREDLEAAVYQLKRPVGAGDSGHGPQEN